jgi:uncharacterized protein YukE
MTKLLMDIEVSHSIVRQINNSCDILHDQLVALSQSVQPFVGSSWISPAATQFSNDFTQWSQSQRQLIEQLQLLAQRLEMEISEWEATFKVD